MKKNFSRNGKIYDFKSLKILPKNKKFTLVHGVFDVLHVGHKRHFESAKKLTDILVVSITSDPYVKKGPGRPFFNQHLRSEMISSLDVVTYVVINDHETPIKLISELKPTYYCKGKDYINYSKDVTGNIQKEANAIKKVGATDKANIEGCAIIRTTIDLSNIEVSKKMKREKIQKSNR